ncbi:MAG: alpha-L-fucosidase [Omnitrophica WOR_2 bacterium]
MPQFPESTAGDTGWFVHDRFGMFIHWGLYALPARHEWVKSQEKISEADYQRYFDHFNPDLFDPKEWAKTAREAGMKYFVITTKHHEGFCLWDTQYTDYKVTNTPYGKDIIRQVVEAFRSEGLKVGFYYSLIDWHHPQFPIDIFHPMRDLPEAPEINKQRDMRIYTRYLHDQVRELLTTFTPDILWLDFSYPTGRYKDFPGKGRLDWQSEELYQMIRQIAPHIILNNRLDLETGPDIYTPEQYQPTEWVKVNGKPVVWEACQTFSGSWGYHRDEATWKSPDQLVQMLINTVSCGGNLLMNVGPTGRGNFDERAKNALAAYAGWMRLNNRSIYGCTQSDFHAPADVRYTQNGKRLYAHIYAWPFRQLHLPELGGHVEYAQMLNDASEVPFKEWNAEMRSDEAAAPQGGIVLSLPVVKPNVTVPVVELFLK